MAIESNRVKAIHIRYFDLDFPPEGKVPIPLIPVIFNEKPVNLGVIPVIFIKKRLFDRISIDSIPNLANKVFGLISEINRSIQQNPPGVQFDCDWSEKTKNKYFLFLRAYRALAKSGISCTIRLHQVKYAGIMGIPPVDYGVLMFYNMGEIDAGSGNSVYEKSIAEKYSPSIKTYPLTLDLALPIFTWSLQLRDGRVIQLLNKMSFAHFENDSNFNRVTATRYSVRNSCFLGGYYFRVGDSVKIEHVSEEDLMDISGQVNQYTNQKIRNLIFYDLDQRNLSLYEKNIIPEIRSRIY